MEEKKNLIPTLKLKARMIGERVPLASAEKLAQEMVERLLLIVEARRQEALAQWAKDQMGADYRKYISQAEKSFWLSYFILMAVQGYNPLTAIRKTPYVFSSRRPKRKVSISPYFFLKKHEMRKTDEIFRKIERLKKYKWRNPATEVMAFKEALPGVPETRVKKYISSKMAPVDIYLDYLCHKFKLPMSGDALKKHIVSARKDQRIKRWCLEEVRRKLGLKRDVSSPP